MRKLIALVFHYSLNGLLADEGTEYYRFCFELLDEAGGPDNMTSRSSFSRAYAHIIAAPPTRACPKASTNTDHPWASIMNAGREVVFSRTLRTADWASTTIAAGDTTEESTSSGKAAKATSLSGAASPLAIADAARPDRRVSPGLAPMDCGRGHPAVRRRPQVLPARPDLQHRPAADRDPRAPVPAAPLNQRGASNRYRSERDRFKGGAVSWYSPDSTSHSIWRLGYPRLRNAATMRSQ